MCNAYKDKQAVTEIQNDMIKLITKIMVAELECHDMKVKNELVVLRDVLDAAKFDHIEKGALAVIEREENDKFEPNWVGGECHAPTVL